MEEDGASLNVVFTDRNHQILLILPLNKYVTIWTTRHMFACYYIFVPSFLIRLLSLLEF